MTAAVVTALLLTVLLAVLMAPSYSDIVEAQEGPGGVDQITFKPPKAVPVNVPFSQEIKATAKVQQPLTLTVASQDYEVKPGDFSSSKSGTGEAQSVTNYTASVGDIKVPETSSFDMSLTQGDETVAEASARAIWG